MFRPTRRWCYRLAGLVVVVVTLSLLLQPAEPAEKPHVAYEAFVKITTGMTLEELEAVFGCPAGDYTRGPFEPPGCAVVRPEEKAIRSKVRTWKQWIYDDGQVTVGFSGDGTVLIKDFTPNWCVPPSLANDIRYALKEIRRALKKLF